MHARAAAGAPAAMVHDQGALGGDEGAEHLGEELHALAGPEPGLEGSGIDLLQVVDGHVTARRPLVDVDPSIVAVEDAVDQLTDGIVVRVAAPAGRRVPAIVRWLRPRIQSMEPFDELREMRADLQIVLARARGLLRELGIVRGRLHCPVHLGACLLAHRAQRMHPVSGLLRPPGVHQPLDLPDRGGDLLAERRHPLERVLHGLRRIDLRLRVIAAAEQPFDELPTAVHRPANVVDETLAFLPQGARVVTEVLPFMEGVFERTLLVIGVHRLLSVHLLDLLRVMALRGLEPLAEDLVPFVQELLAGLRHVERLVQLLMAFPGPCADLVHELAQRGVFAEYLAHLPGDRSHLLQT